MKAILKSYNSKENYDNERPSSEQMEQSIQKALSIAKSHISAAKKGKKFKGFKVFTTKGEIKYKLPSW